MTLEPQTPVMWVRLAVETNGTKKCSFIVNDLQGRPAAVGADMLHSLLPCLQSRQYFNRSSLSER